MINQFTEHGWWAALHGVVLGGAYLLALVLAIVTLPQLAPSGGLTEQGAQRRILWLCRGGLIMVIVAWSTVFLATIWVDAWFHLQGATSPEALLTARPSLAWWDEWAIEWKERVGWISAIFATTGWYVVVHERTLLVRRPAVRWGAVVLLGAALAFGALAALTGMLLAKLAPLP